MKKWADIRTRFFTRVLDVVKFQEGQLLGWPLLLLRWATFPIDSLYWCLSGQRGYPLRTDTWLINGYVFSAQIFRIFTHGEVPGRWFRVVNRDENTITIETLDSVIGDRQNEI